MDEIEQFEFKEGTSHIYGTSATTLKLTSCGESEDMWDIASIEKRAFDEWVEIQPETFETERKLNARWQAVRTMRLKHLTNINKDVFSQEKNKRSN